MAPGDPVCSPNSPYTWLLCVTSAEFGIQRNPVTKIKLQTSFIESLLSTTLLSKSRLAVKQRDRSPRFVELTRQWVQMHVSLGEMSDQVRRSASPLPKKAPIKLNKINKNNHFSTLERPKVYTKLRGFYTRKTAELLLTTVGFGGVLASTCSDTLPSCLVDELLSGQGVLWGPPDALLLEGGSCDSEQCVVLTFSSRISGGDLLRGIEQGSPTSLLAWAFGHGWGKCISSWGNTPMWWGMESTQRKRIYRANSNKRDGS